MADRSLIAGVTGEIAGSASLTAQGRNTVARTAPGGEGLHFIMGYIAALWPNFAAGRTPDQKRAMIAVWERALDDIPIKLQKAALDKKVRAGQLYPPSSPAELRTWCDEVQPPMQSWQVKWYADMAELGFFDPEFCRRQIEKFEAGEKAGRNVYVGWED